MSGVNIIFYSRTCATCKNLLNILMNEDLLKFFKMYCVDDNLNNVPSYIHTVPTMIVANINKPLVAQEAFAWIQKMKFIKQDASKQILQNKITNILNKSNDPIGYTQLEMGGLSDPFAYKDIDMPLIHNYQNIKTGSGLTIFTAPEQEKLRDHEQAQKIKYLEKIRDDQNEEYTKQMKEQQLKAVISSQKENDRN